MNFVLALLTALQVWTAEPPATEPPFQRQLLCADWAGVAACLQSQSTVLPAPIRQALLGHVWLNQNSNNLSLECFIALSNAPACASWLEWTTQFAAHHPKNRVALFLRGDGLARSGRFPEAILHYTQALTIDPNFAPVLVARGVARTYQGEDLQALEDLERACAIAPGLADAHASLGVFWLRREAPEGAQAAFDKALNSSPNFALALNGRACARIGFSQEAQSLQAAMADFAKAATCLPANGLVKSNIQNVLHFASERSKATRLATREGTTIKVREMLHEGGAISSDKMNRMSTPDLARAMDRFQQNAVHSERWGGIVDKVNGSFQGTGLNLSGWSKSSYRDAGDWRNLQTQAYSELQRRGFDPSQGGARTADLANGYLDSGHWPVSTLFGLMQ